MASFDSSGDEQPLDGTVKSLLTLWCVLLFLDVPVLLMSGMAFEGGVTLSAIYSLTVVSLYPIMVGLAYAYRRSKPALVWLPAIPIVLMVLSMATNWPK